MGDVVIFSVPHLEKLGGKLCHKDFYYSKAKLIPYLSGFEYKFYYYEDATIYENVGVPEKNQVWPRKSCSSDEESLNEQLSNY